MTFDTLTSVKNFVLLIGWYSAVVKSYDCASDLLEVEYLLERGYKYTMNYTDMLTKGLLEPTKPILAKLETYEKVTTIGQEVQIRIDSGMYVLCVKEKNILLMKSCAIIKFPETFI